MADFNKQVFSYIHAPWKKQPTVQRLRGETLSNTIYQKANETMRYMQFNSPLRIVGVRKSFNRMYRNAMIEIFSKVYELQKGVFENAMTVAGFCLLTIFVKQNHNLADNLWWCVGFANDGLWKLHPTTFCQSFNPETDQVDDKTGLVRNAKTSNLKRNWSYPDRAVLVGNSKSSIKWARHTPFQLFNIIL